MARLTDTAETADRFRFKWLRPLGSPSPRFDRTRGLILTKPNLSAVYYPFESDLRTLPTAFAKVVDERTAVAFTRKYGRLGFWAVVEDQEDCGQPFDWAPHDPAAWVLTQADTVGFALAVIAALQSGEREQLERALGKHRAPPAPPLVPPLSVAPADDDLSTFACYLAAGDSRREASWYTLVCDRIPAEPTDDALRAHARRILAALVNGNTAGVRTVIREAGGLRYGLTARALIEVIWKHVGDAALGGRVKTCAACFAPFIATDARQNYCPPDPATDTPSGKRARSKCEQRARRQREQGSSSEPKDTP